MASTPTFGSTPRFGSVQLANADGTTAKDVANFTPVSAGTRVKEIRVIGSSTTTPGGSYRTLILVHDGTNARVLESFTLQNTADIVQAIFRYDNLKLPDANHKLQVQIRTTLGSGSTLDFIVMGEDLT